MVITKMKMRYLTLIVLAIFCISANGQTLQIDNFKTSLNHYETLCKQLLEEIDYIKKHDKELNLKAEPKTRVMNLVINITKEINSNDAKNKGFYNKLKELRDSLGTAQAQSPVNPTTEVSTPIHNPITNVRDENPKVEENEGDIREGNGENPDPKPLREVRGGNKLEMFLSQYTLADIYQHRNEIEMEMRNKYQNNPKRTSYTYVIQLFDIQYKRYDRKRIKDLLAKISSVQGDILEKHKSELDEEIVKVNDYRYATKELQRLLGIVDNPPAFGTDATSSKWDDDKSIDTKQLKEYLENKNETEYVYKFDYTKKQFEKYLNANAVDRIKIKSEIADALAN